MKEKKLSVPQLFVYFFLLLAIWSLQELLLRPMLDTVLASWLTVLIRCILKFLFFTVPAVYFIRRFESGLLIPFKEMFANRVSWVKYLPIALVFFIYHLTALIRTTGNIEIRPDLTWTSYIDAAVFAGITEEPVFRAFLLNALCLKMKNRFAILITGCMFVVIHFPVWIYSGALMNPVAVFGNCIVIFLLSAVFSHTFLKSKNILVPTALHMLWNLLVLLLRS